MARMAIDSLVIAIVLGVIQGVFEWLPISSEGNVALALSVLGTSPAAAVRFALFLHLGTALAATAYYRREIRRLLETLPGWRPSDPFGEQTVELTFLAVATLVSGIVGVGSYVVLVDLASRLAGGAFVAVIGGLLIATGLVQRTASGGSVDRLSTPDLLDAVLVGVGQGLAILPGVSRSGTTVSVLLLRGHDGESSFRWSFLLSIPAAVGAAGLAFTDSGGAGFESPSVWLVALATSAIVGYVTIGALMRVVRRVAFWAVCVGIGALAVVGGLLVLGI